uniref:Uncharacterized protein n=1 Tax=Ascaris lumbricoides TaxID=6252 RepID=A0A9J2Q6E8_ASCLU
MISIALGHQVPRLNCVAFQASKGEENEEVEEEEEEEEKEEEEESRSLNGERTVQYLDWDELRRSRDKRSFIGYGDFTGLGNFNNFESSVDQAHIAMDEGATPQPLSGNGRRQGNSNFNLQQEIIWIKQDSAQIRNAVVLLEKEKDNLRQAEIIWIKQDSAQIRNAVVLLEKEKDNLRQAVRKLKLENARVKQKMKRMQETINGLSGASAEADNIKVGAAEVDLDYDDIGRDFILVGGTQDPLSLRFEVAIRDERGIEHKSAERYYWYKMAEHFGDTETMAKILDAPTTIKAEEAMKEIKDFDEAKWNEASLIFIEERIYFSRSDIPVKMSVWEAGQRLKLEQTRWISNLLVYTGKTYIAVASQDKEIEKRYNELKKYVWRRIDPARRLGILRGRGRGFGRRGGFGGRGYGAPSAFAQSVRH